MSRDKVRPDGFGASPLSVIAIFERQVRRDPNAIALRASGGNVSYQELDQTSNCVAWALRKAGVTKGSAVAISMARTPEFISALLGILKSGGAYMPINDAWPQARVETVLKAASVPIALVDDLTKSRLEGLVPTLNIRDEAKTEGGSRMEKAPSVPVGPEDLAYINFTSGSSGTPKGVMVPHRGITSVLVDQTYIDLSARTITLQIHEPSFDPTTFEIWGPLLHGGGCAFLDSPFITPTRVGAAIHDHHVNTMIMPPTLFNMIVDDAPEVLKSLETLLVGGEAMSPHHVNKANVAAPELPIFNAYGPSEATFIATYFPVAEMKQDAASVPLGYPLNNRGVHILNSALEPVQAGEVGEICISGPGLALGYLRDEERTAQAFVTTDAIGGPPRRVYRTGDRGCVSDAGIIESHGRTDTQIQLNGFRIELEEVDRNLVAHPDVKLAATSVFGDGVGAQLCAAVVASNGLPTDLASHLAKLLPSYMVPRKFLVLEELPLNSHGKIDRNRVAELADIEN